MIITQSLLDVLKDASQALYNTAQQLECAEEYKLDNAVGKAVREGVESKLQGHDVLEGFIKRCIRENKGELE